METCANWLLVFIIIKKNKMALFLSTFVNKIDKKGRVSVPATFRAALSSESFQGFVAFRSYRHQGIECCSESRMAEIASSVDSLDMFSDEQDDLTAAIFADALQIPFDGDGRIVLPQKLREYANIDDQIAFVGRGKTFQLWHPDVFVKVQEEARKRVQEKQATLKVSPHAPQNPNTSQNNGQGA